MLVRQKCNKFATVWPFLDVVSEKPVTRAQEFIYVYQFPSNVPDPLNRGTGIRPGKIIQAFTKCSVITLTSKSSCTYYVF